MYLTGLSMININVPNFDKMREELTKALNKLNTNKFVTVGIHESDNARAGDGMTNAKLGAIQHYGATINHPGGTSYGYTSKKDMIAGKVRFLKSGTGHAEMGTTAAHTITIPPRPWLDTGLASVTPEIIDTIVDSIADGELMDQILNRIGVVAVAGVQNYMDELDSPPNAPGTIAKKGSDNPLIDTGELKQSVTYAITSNRPTEGL